MMKKNIWLLAVGCWLLAAGLQAQPDWVNDNSPFERASGFLTTKVNTDLLMFNTQSDFGAFGAGAQYIHNPTTGSTPTPFVLSSNSTGNNYCILMEDADGTPNYGGFGLISNQLRMFTGGSVNANYINIGGAGAVTISALADGSLSSVSGVITSSSDARLKNLRGSFSAGLHALKGIQPMRYTWNEKSGLNSSREYAGFVAQNVEYNIPEAVSVGKDGMKSLNITPILAAAINAINEQQRQIEKLQAEIRELKSYFQ